MVKYLLLIFLLATGFLFGKTAVIQHTPKQITIEFSLPELYSESIEIDEISYTRLYYDNADMLVQMGAPAIPYSLVRVAIPPEAEVRSSFDVIQQQEINAISVVPFTILSGLAPEPGPQRDEAIYRSSNPYPGLMVEVGEPYHFRGMRMVDVKIYPVQFSPAREQVRLLKKVQIRLQISKAGFSGAKVALTSAAKDILRKRVVNFRQAQEWRLPPGNRLAKTQVNYDLSRGSWYKIPIAAEGVYQVTGAFLQSQGIDIASIDPATIQVFSYGGRPLPTNTTEARPQDLNEIAVEVVDVENNGRLDPNDKVIFYAQGPNGWYYNSNGNPARWKAFHNPYSSVINYMLTFNQAAGKRIPSSNSIQNGSAVRAQRFPDQYRFEDDTMNWLQSGTSWFWLKFSGTIDSRSVPFTLPQNFFPENMQLFIRLQGGSGSHYWDTRPNYTYTFNIAVNNQPAVQNYRFVKNSSASIYGSTAALRPGANQMDFDYSSNLEGSYAYLDYFEVRMERPFIAENQHLKFYHMLNNTPVEFTISNLPGGANRVWDVSDFANVRQINPLQNGATVTFQDQHQSLGEIPKQYLVFAPSIIRPVQEMAPLENSPNLRNPDRKGKMLIIVADEFYDAAAAWEDFRETHPRRPMEVERVKVSDIYKEFSSCTPDPTAIRDFIKYAHENWGSALPELYQPEYVFLLGDGSYDYRNIELTNYINRVPVFEINGNNDVNSRVSDNFFTAIYNNRNDLRSLDPQLAIGRVTANSVHDVENMLNKMITYNNSFLYNEAENGWQTVLTFVADDECAGNSICNEAYHTRQTERIVGLVPHKFDLKKIYLTEYETEVGGLGRLKPKASSDLMDQINRGALAINYFGHGDPNTWAHEQVLSKARDLPRINNPGRLPLWIAATCTWGKYDDPNEPSMAEEMIWAENGGIAVLAAARPVYAFENESFVRRVFENLFYNKDDRRRSRVLGDAVLMSLGGGDNDQKYHLLGDPATQLADPEHQIRITSISDDTLKALSTVTITAQVVDSSNRILNNFNGKALIRVFDAVDTTRNLGLTYTKPGGGIFRGIVTVENGELQGNFIVPKSIKYENSYTGRISIYAWGDQNSRDAVGYNDSLLFTGTASQINDTRGPRISFSIPEQPDFFDGDYVNAQPTVIVRLGDDNGINLTGETGHQIILTIDGRVRKDVTEFFVYDENSFQEGELRYTLPALSPGNHRLTISAWDNLNNYSEEQVSFVTTNASKLTLEQVVNYPNPFSEDTQFTFQFQSPNQGGEVRIKIYTVTGRLIQEIEDIAQPGFNKIYWDGRDRDGDKLGNGVYLYKIVVDDGENSIEKIEKFAIVR